MTDSLLSLCLTWRNINGQCKLFVNSALVATVTDFSENFIIQPGGILHLGGRPSQFPERFIGNISHFNMWSYVLPTQVIAVLGQRCGIERGDVISWETFKNAVGSGDVEVVEDICPGQGVY